MFYREKFIYIQRLHSVPRVDYSKFDFFIYCFAVDALKK